MLATPSRAKRLRRETHEAAINATEQVGKLNKILEEDITFKIHIATTGEPRNAR